MTNDTPTPNDNPHDFTDHVLKSLAETSSAMYDEFYDFLAMYGFDFTLEQKEWMLQRIVKDIRQANKEAEMDMERNE